MATGSFGWCPRASAARIGNPDTSRWSLSETWIVEQKARKESDAAFQKLAERYRGEILLHCYRMLGSLHDAEDTVQETLLRAWRGMDRFEGRASPRVWLYRIATNACLTALARAKARRVLPETQGPPVGFAPLGEHESETLWLEPYPDAALDRIADLTPGPEARYEMREAIQLAFIAAIQELPPRQRATLLLRDVLGWSALETADLLESSVASVNSALQRARSTLTRRVLSRPTETRLVADDRQRTLLGRYLQTWEASDVDGFISLLKEDAVWTMPPWREWFVGRATIKAFISWAWRPERGRRQHLVPTAANGRPAFGYYRSEREGSEWRAFAIQVLALQDDAIASVTNFVDARLFAAFGLPPALPRTPDR